MRLLGRRRAEQGTVAPSSQSPTLALTLIKRDVAVPSSPHSPPVPAVFGTGLVGPPAPNLDKMEGKGCLCLDCCTFFSLDLTQITLSLHHDEKRPGDFKGVAQSERKKQEADVVSEKATRLPGPRTRQGRFTAVRTQTSHTDVKATGPEQSEEALYTVPPLQPPPLSEQPDSQAECGRWSGLSGRAKGDLATSLCRTGLVGNNSDQVPEMCHSSTDRPGEQRASPSPSLVPSPMAADATWRPQSLQPASRRRRAPAGSPKPMSVSCTEKALSAGGQAARRPLLSPLSRRPSVTARLHVLCVD
ncbi:unnamed protein product [Pleuronectes platessa]|uniref:Uncharacterized protein n=1 Tax=Pleuronectes platessa TaxID=8262 RepID=A0A9N7YT36_PLEPL|nr:unnamed protein product [Pleuronectes platessa]